MILVLGTVCLDRIRRIPAIPAPGGYVEIESESLLLGGEAANTANSLKHWGADVRLFGNALGEGAEGQILRDLVSEHGLRCEGLGVDVGRTRCPVCDVYVTPDGDRTMFGMGFADMEPSFNPSLLPWDEASWVTVEPNMSGLAREAAREANERGIKTYLMDFAREDEPIAAGSFWQSSTDWAGRRGDLEFNLEWAARWSDRYGCTTLLSDGPRDLVVARAGSGALSLPTFPAPAVVDTTGAGDAFRAGMLFGLEQGWDLARCLMFASAAGALSCGALGATSWTPTVAEVEAQIEAHAEVATAYRRMGED